MNKFKQIYKMIKKYDTIVLARHIGPDPDALGSTIGLKETILNTFPNKKVYAVGVSASRHKYIGQLDKITPDICENALLIVLDTPNVARIDGVDITKFKNTIKIDHHPFIEKFADIEVIDDTASSASQLVIELIKNTKLIPNKKGAESLYVGVVADTNRFLHSYTTSKTFDLVSYLIKETNIDFTKLYTNMYLRSLSDFKFLSYILNNITLENGFGYAKITQEILDEFKLDASTAANYVNDLTFIDNMYAWGLFVYDRANENIRGSLRSRGPIVNDIATKYNGGGHAMAAGVRVKTFDEVDPLVEELQKRCTEYKEGEKIE